jgi:hypothetical protein
MGNIGMEILKFENAPAPRKSAPKKSNLKSLAGLATVAAVAVLGSTLAANISLGTGSALEFGQGVQTTAACDSSITVSPKVTFVNSSTNPQFMLSTISLSDVDATNQASDTTGCDGKTLTINAYGDTLATPLSIASSSNTAYSYATVGVKASGTMTTSPGVTVTVIGTQNSTTAGIDVAITSPQATSGAVYKLTLQSN